MIKNLALGLLLALMLNADSFAQPDPEGATDSFYVIINTDTSSILSLQIRFFSDNKDTNRVAAFALPLVIDATNDMLTNLDTSVATAFAGSAVSSFALKVTTTDSCCGAGADPTQFPVHFILGAASFTGGVSGDGLFCTLLLTYVDTGTICIDTLSTQGLGPTLVTEYAYEYGPGWFVPVYTGWGGIRKCTILDVDKQHNHSTSLPETFLLEQNTPNPFNATTQIRFNLPSSSHVKLEVFDVLGRKVTTLVDEFVEVGYKQVTWDGKNDGGERVASGVFFYRLKTGDFIDTMKMVLLR